MEPVHLTIPGVPVPWQRMGAKVIVPGKKADPKRLALFDDIERRIEGLAAIAGRTEEKAASALIERVRLARRDIGVMGGTPFASFYMKPESREFQQKVKDYAEPHFPNPLSGPVVVEVVAWWPMRGKPRKRVPRPVEWYEGKSDTDNVVKNVRDGLEGVAYHNDSQVVRGEDYGFRCPQERDEPRVEVRIAPAGEPKPPFWYRV